MTDLSCQLHCPLGWPQDLPGGGRGKHDRSLVRQGGGWGKGDPPPSSDPGDAENGLDAASILQEKGQRQEQGRWARAQERTHQAALLAGPGAGGGAVHPCCMQLTAQLPTPATLPALQHCRGAGGGRNPLHCSPGRAPGRSLTCSQLLGSRPLTPAGPCPAAPRSCFSAATGLVPGHVCRTVQPWRRRGGGSTLIVTEPPPFLSCPTDSLMASPEQK